MSAANKVLGVLLESRSNRDKQTHVGPSEIGGCRRRVWYRLNGTPECNDTLKLPALMGTAIHRMLERTASKHDPFGTDWQIEVELVHDGLMGHADLYSSANREVVDWKTTKKASLSKFPSEQQRWQVQLYGWLANANGLPTETVTLVGIPRDGDERNIVVHSEPYDETVAQEALTWLSEVRDMTEPPPPQETRRFCSLYCSWFDGEGVNGCPSRT
jgi:CRISPR/Cas system-associated exonuclease Cas4 (RecB family)